MNVFLTGAFGSVGSHTLGYLLERKYDVTCFDIKNKNNEKTYKKLVKKGKFKTVWGDITDLDSVSEAMGEVDCILHLAALIPPITEQRPELAMKVNVQGTKYIVDCANKLTKKPKIVYVSSISVHGPRMHEKPPVKADDELRPTSVYTNSKVEAEKIVKNSGIPWTIVRLGVAPMVSGNFESFDEAWEMPLDQRIEFIHPKDVGLALTNSVTANINGKILLLGGGNHCRMTSGDFYKKLFGAMGIKMFPKSAFRTPKPPSEAPDEWYFTDWMDTEEAQKLLQFQSCTLDDYIKDLKSNLGFLITLSKLFSPLVYKMLLKRSPYYRKQNKGTA